MDTIRVLIVDDHPMVRRGLQSLLSSHQDIEVVGECSDGAAALQQAAASLPDVILLDIQLPGLDGIGVAHQLQRVVPNSKIIALTAFENEEYVASALRAGAYAYLLKTASGEGVVEAIRLVNQGKRLISSPLMDQVLKQFQDMARVQARQDAGLSEEELKVLRLIAQGATNEEIAEKMFWGDRTVKRMVEEIISKLNARNRAQAVAEAIRMGLI